MEGKIVVITGGNSGIGYSTAQRLAQQKYKVVIACRTEEKGDAAVTSLKEKSGNTDVHFVKCNLANLDSVRTCAQKIRSQFDRVDVLINNAGYFGSKLKKTNQGFEMQFGVNHIGHFLLTTLLLDAIKLSSDGRIINVSSNAHYSGNIDFNSLRGERSDYSSMKAYSQSKLANVLFTKELVHRYPEIKSYALHPGVVKTGIANKHANWAMSTLWNFLKVFMVSPEKGANTSVYLATETIDAPNGSYFNDKQKVKTPNTLALDRKLAEELWSWTEKAVTQ